MGNIIYFYELIRSPSASSSSSTSSSLRQLDISEDEDDGSSSQASVVAAAEAIEAWIPTTSGSMEPITNALIQVLVQQLYNSLIDEGNSLHGFRSEFEKMKTKLDVMTSFLIDAQLLQRNDKNYPTVKAILAQLRDLAYDAEDILLECQTREASKEVFMLRGYTLRGWSFRHNAGNTLNQISKIIDHIESIMKTYFTPMNHMIQSSNEKNIRWRTTSHAFGQSKIIGLTRDTQTLIERIFTTNEKSHSIGIVGMGGLGKTRIAQMIFNDKEVIGHFDRRIWVSVSQSFNEKDILTSMLKQLRVKERGHTSYEMSQIQQSLNNKNYLIVLDDVWSLDYDWRRLISALPEGEECKKSIIITTRNKNVARIMGVTYIHNARELDENESWSLFCDVAFSGNQSMSGDPELHAVAENIVEKCQGLPLAIKTIAGLVSTKTQSFRAWEEVSMNFCFLLADKTSVSDSLQLSYDDLPAVLKHCILCFSIYPEDYEISAEQLVYWWVGEGFVHGSGLKTAVEVAFECLLELVDRCLVEVVKQRGYDGKVQICKMHGMVRDMIIRMAKEEAFSIFDIRNRQVPDEISRHLGYTSEMDHNLLKNNSKLRAFLLMENCLFHLQRDCGMASVKSLRVLDLSCNKLDNISVEDLLSWIKSQKLLAYLNLRGVGDLKELPDWIQNRKNLQILVIRECNNLKRLNPLITTLHNLVVLDVENCSLQSLPRGLGRLTKLQVLSGFKLAPRGKDGARLSEIMGLTELRKLGINFSEKDDIADDEVVILSKLHQLKVLSMDTKDCGEKQVELVNKLVPPPSLQELYLRFYCGDTTPNWISPSFLPYLQYLHIESGQLTSVGTHFWADGENCWKIEGLCLKHLFRLELDWEVVQRNMKYLWYVEVSRCPGLSRFPCDVNNYGVYEREEN